MKLVKFIDFLWLFDMHFPKQSFRFGNMTANGIKDVINTYAIAPKIPFTRIAGTKKTIN